MIDFMEILPHGKKNAVRMSDLAEQLGYSDTRSLRKDIHEYNAEGKGLICSTSNSKYGGYFVPSTREEIAEYIRFHEGRIKSASQSIHHAREIMKKISGQERMETDSDGLKIEDDDLLKE